jgi:hypothetical protein
MRLRALAMSILTASLTCWSLISPADAKTTSAGPTLLKAIVLNMGRDGPTVTDARYDNLFKERDAAAGVAAVIAAGRFSINGFGLPGTAAAFEKAYPAGYMVNQVPWILYDAGRQVWKGGYKAEKATHSYTAAALATATGIVAGLEVRFYDTDGDRYVDRIGADYKEGVIVSDITPNSDKTYSLNRGGVETSDERPSSGRVFDGAHFTTSSGERIISSNFDRTITSGDVALFWFGPLGWVVQRAKQVRGRLLGGADHKNYNIEGVAYQDAMRFSRDNIPISNRPGEYVNAHAYFGFDKALSGSGVNLWLVPTTDPIEQGAPIALTSGAAARDFLGKAIVLAETMLHSATVSIDGSDVSADNKWVSQAAHERLSAAIEHAKAALTDSRSNPWVRDYQVYLLYLSLAGSSGDIGAKFGGFNYVGFEHEMKAGSRVASHKLGIGSSSGQ